MSVPTTSAHWSTPVLPPIPALTGRTRWNRFRRWWKDLLQGRPEDRLRDGADEERSGPSLLFLAVASGLVLAPLGGAWIEDTAARLGLVTLTVFAVAAALQLEALERAGNAGIAAGVRGLLAGIAATGLLAVGIRFAPDTLWTGSWLAVALLLLMALALRNEPRACVTAGTTLLAGFVGFQLWQLPTLHGSSTAGTGAFASVALALGTGFSASLAKRGRDLQRSQHRDGPTRLLGRQAMLACLAREAERSSRSGLPITLAVIEASGLGTLRARRGAPLADALFGWIASLAHESVRSSDLVARFGDDQIVIAFLDSADPVLGQRLEQLAARAESIVPEADGGEPERLDVRIGRAEYPRDDIDVAGALALALARAGFDAEEGRGAAPVLAGTPAVAG